MALSQPLRQSIHHANRTIPAAPSTLVLRCIASSNATTRPHQHHQRRHIHPNHRMPPPPVFDTPPPQIPKPTPFVPNVLTFLTLIGRGLSAHASKITSWDALFSLTTAQLRALGVEPARSRRYLLRWRTKFRRGDVGIGANLVNVDRLGRGEIRAVEVPIDELERVDGISGLPRPAATVNQTPGMTTIVVNVPPEYACFATAGAKDAGEADEAKDEGDTENDKETKLTFPRIPVETALRLPRPELGELSGIKYSRMAGIHGHAIEDIKGAKGRAGLIRVKEGLWEHKRGVKVDGGERRKVQVRAKRRSAENRAAAAA